MSKHPGSIWIEKNYDTLPTNEWIAASINGFVDHDPNYDALIKKLQSKSINLSGVVIMFVPGKIVQ